MKKRQGRENRIFKKFCQIIKSLDASSNFRVQEMTMNKKLTMIGLNNCVLVTMSKKLFIVCGFHQGNNYCHYHQNKSVSIWNPCSNLKFGISSTQSVIKNYVTF